MNYGDVRKEVQGRCPVGCAWAMATHMTGTKTSPPGEGTWYEQQKTHWDLQVAWKASCMDYMTSAFGNTMTRGHGPKLSSVLE